MAAAKAPYYDSDMPAGQRASENEAGQAPPAIMNHEIGPAPTSSYPEPAQTDEGAYLHRLVAAATSAAMEDRPSPHESGPSTYPFAREMSLNGTRKRKQPQPETQAPQSERQSRSKRPRQATTDTVQDPPSASLTDHETNHLIDARAMGVHSAAALFRPASELSKKYTRPPMSKLFTSLDLSAEDFLKLQAAAKKYMLDPAHPERRNGVGNRGAADSGQVRLDLAKCVRAFLEEGSGEEFFGIGPAGPAEGEGGAEGVQRTSVWPTDKDRIVSLCTPLLRRMVTNERQRQYAVENRRTSKSRRNGSGDVTADQNDEVSLMMRMAHYA